MGEWVNSDLLKMAKEIEAQADAVGDEDAFRRPGARAHLRTAATKLREAFTELELLGEEDTIRNAHNLANHNTAADFNAVSPNLPQTNGQAT